MADLQFSNPGPFATCYAETRAGQDWLEENVGDEETCTCGFGPFGAVVVIEHRYLEDIVTGARDAGLLCEG